MVFYARMSHPGAVFSSYPLYPHRYHEDNAVMLDHWNCTTPEEKLSWMSLDKNGEDYDEVFY